MSNSHSAFIKGAAILAVAGISVRFLGAALRILLAALMGDEGIGLYQMAYPIFSTLLAISTAGIPVAISKLVAENIALQNYREAFRVFKISLGILTLTGLILTLILAVSARFTAEAIIQQPRALYSLIAISPAIFLVTIMSAFRGFFQGQQIMIPTAISQIMEQVGRVAASLILVIVFLPAGLELAAAGASFGATFGSLLGLLVVIIVYFRNRRSFQRLLQKQHLHHPASRSAIIRKIFSLAVPITFGSLILPLNTLIDLAVVHSRLLDAGFPQERATALYGQLTGMASSVIYFPNVVIIALSMSLVPAIAEAFALKNRPLIAGRTSIAVRLTMLFSLPASVGLYVLATPITVLLFKNVEAGYSLALMSWSVVPLSLYITSTGIMQGLGKPIMPVLNMVFGGAVKTVVAWHLTANPDLHVGGAAIASVVGLGVAALLNLHYLKRLTGWRFQAGDLVIFPGIAAAVMASAVFLTYNFLNRAALEQVTPGMANGLAVVAAIFLGVIVYGLALLISGSLYREDLLLIPRLGPRLVALADRFRLFRD